MLVQDRLVLARFAFVLMLFVFVLCARVVRIEWQMIDHKQLLVEETGFSRGQHALGCVVSLFCLRL